MFLLRIENNINIDFENNKNLIEKTFLNYHYLRLKFILIDIYQNIQTFY